MSDTTEAPAIPTQETPAAESPAPAAFDPTAFEKRIADLMEERVKGFQRIISERDTKLADLERQLKTASMSEEERAQLVASEEKERLEQLALENQLLRLGQQYPTEVAIVQKMLAGESVEDYVAALHEAMKVTKAPEKEPEQDVSDVDRNNPPATPVTASAGQDMVSLPDGRALTREAALEILKAASTLHG